MLRLLLRFLANSGVGDLSPILLEFVRQRLAAELLLDRLHLLVQVVLALAILHLLLDPAPTNILLQAIEGHLGFHQSDDPLHALVQLDGFENRLSVFELERELGSQWYR